MSSRVPSYLRTERRRWALTQKELATLLGCRSSSYISRLEHDERMPGTDIILACEVLFGISPRALFPKLYTDIEEAVISRAANLYATLEAETTRAALRKKELLSTALNRAITRLNEPEGV